MIAHPLALDRPLEEAIRASLDGLLGDAIEVLQHPPDKGGVDKAVHESRKRMKEVRSLLRLLGGALVDDDKRPVRKEANARLRDAAQTIGGARDAAVRMQTLDGLVDAFADHLPDVAFAALRQKLEFEHKAQLEQTAGDDVAGVVEALQHVREQAAAWRLKPSKWKAIAPGLKRLYATGRQESADCAATREGQAAGDAHLYHEWRKRAKDLRYALEYLSLLPGDLLAPQRALAKALTDDLGLDHDLHVLVHHALANYEDIAHPKVLVALAESRRALLEDAAAEKAALLYAEPPKAFVRRVKAYWKHAT